VTAKFDDISQIYAVVEHREIIVNTL